MSAQSRNTLGEFARHEAMAWIGSFVVSAALGLALDDSTAGRVLFRTPGAAPYFWGSLLVGAVLGAWYCRRRRSWLAVFAFALPLLWFLAVANDFHNTSGPNGGWLAVNRGMFSNYCEDSECLGPFLATQPLFAAAAYSIAALVVMVWPMDKTQRSSNRKMEDRP